MTPVTDILQRESVTPREAWDVGAVATPEWRLALLDAITQDVSTIIAACARIPHRALQYLIGDNGSRRLHEIADSIQRLGRTEYNAMCEARRADAMRLGHAVSYPGKKCDAPPADLGLLLQWYFHGLRDEGHATGMDIAMHRYRRAKLQASPEWCIVPEEMKPLLADEGVVRLFVSSDTYTKADRFGLCGDMLASKWGVALLDPARASDQFIVQALAHAVRGLKVLAQCRSSIEAETH